LARFPAPFSMSCPIYLSPATTRTKPIRLHQVWQPAPVDVDEDDLPDRGGGRQGSAPSVPRLPADNASADGDQSPAATRITLRPHDPGTGEEIEKREVVKGYEYSRGQFLTFTAEVRQHVRGTRAESGAGPVLGRARLPARRRTAAAILSPG
jgi:hypothetical protein